MKFDLEVKYTQKDTNKVRIIIQANPNQEDIENIISYIKNYDKNRQTALVSDGYITKEVKVENIISFFSEDKINYCRTRNKIYKIKSKLYELENINNNFIRISKNCVVNFEQVDYFDMSEKGKIIVKLSDGTEELVARRRLKYVLDFLRERSI